MKISVIVPVYNSAPYIGACLDSILSQTHTDLEIIVINDGSTDESGALCDGYAAKDNRIHVIHQSNAGASAARNAGLEMASGDWITFVDSDDAIEPDMYEMLIELAQKHQADVVHCGYKKIQFDGTAKDVQGTGELLVQDKWQAAECLLIGKSFTGSTWTKLYRKPLFDGIRFHAGLTINEDVLINAELFAKAQKLVFWDVTKYHYYEREQSVTRTTNQMKIRQDCVNVAQRILELYRATPVESCVARRLIYMLLDMYRFCLLTDRRGTREERSLAHQKILRITKKYGNLSSRTIWNYRFMRHFPLVYTMTYRVYRKIRKPNYDL